MASYGTVTDFEAEATDARKFPSYPMGRCLGDSQHRSEFMGRANDTTPHEIWLFVHFIFLSNSLYSLFFWLYVFYLINAGVTYYFCYFNNDDS